MPNPSTQSNDPARRAHVTHGDLDDCLDHPEKYKAKEREEMLKIVEDAKSSKEASEGELSEESKENSEETEKSEDSEYTYKITKDKLVLEGKNGKFNFKRK